MRDTWLQALDRTAMRGGLFLTICHAFITGIDDARVAALDAVMRAAVSDARITILTVGEIAQQIVARNVTATRPAGEARTPRH